MNKKILKIIGVIIAFILCFPFHFLYDKFPCFLTSMFAPVNESIWEHMKLLFGSIIVSGIIQKLIIIYRKEKVNNICFSNFIGALLSIPIFLILFLLIYFIIGENFILTISIMLLTIILSEIISYKIMNQKDFNMENKTIIFVIIIYSIFTLLTYFPLKNVLFIDPTNNTYGIR